MAKWTLEKMTEELKSSLQEELVSVLLYGSSVTGDHAGKLSDTNLLVVTRILTFKELQKVSKVVASWARQGHPPPLFLTQNHLRDYTSVFPLEISDILENHKVLYGQDPLPELPVPQDRLKMELDHEFHGKLLQLKTRFLLTESVSKKVEKLMVESLSTFLILLKHTLRFYGKKPPAKKMEALAALREYLPLDLEVFETLEKLKQGERPKNFDVLLTFRKYLATLETAAAKISADHG